MQELYGLSIKDNVSLTALEIKFVILYFGLAFKLEMLCLRTSFLHSFIKAQLVLHKRK